MTIHPSSEGPVQQRPVGSRYGARTGWHWLAIGLVLLLGAWHAHRLFWTCDDAFISFRYADHLVAGKGLVYNEVERVEGYSNFLWTVLIALGRWVSDVDAAVLGNWLGLLFYGATILLLVVATCRSGTAAALPVAAVGLSGHYHFKVFASCGLETAMVTFFITAMLLAVIAARTSRGYLLAGVLGAIVAMTRADGPLPYGLAGLFVLWQARQTGNWRWFLAMVLPGLVLWVPYFLLRWNYYGDIFANVFYAKSVGHAYPGQGVVYAGMFFACYWILVPAVLGALYLALRPGPDRRAGLAIAMLVLPYTLFIVWIGGDFMFARYLIPITPALYLVFDRFGARLTDVRWSSALAVAVGSGSLLMIYPEDALTVRGDRRSELGIVEERTIYTPERTAEFRRTGREVYARLLAGTRSRVAIAGGQAALAYYGRFWLVIECATGLTDRTIARQELQTRGMVGHEKQASKDYLLSRHVNFVLFAPESLGFHHPLDRQLRTLEIGPLRITILCWSSELMAAIRARVRAVLGPDGDSLVRFTDVEAYLDRYLDRAGEKSGEQLRADLDYFEEFYFDHNEDPQRLARFRSAIAGK